MGVLLCLFCDVVYKIGSIYRVALGTVREHTLDGLQQLMLGIPVIETC